ncbi:hypothetical protein BC943DRAFT_308322 [Umbelopsis sp. AD052]|nr:hypothetical protein BC943DRAFT_308322 [Umbelopsis sp. AD052]
MVEQVLQDEKRAGHSWTVLQYNEYYMSMLFQAKYDAIISNWEQEFCGSDIKPTIATINSVLAAYIQLNQLERARVLLSRCHEWDVTPTMQDFQRLAHRCLPRNTKVVKEAQTLITDNALKDPKAMNRHLQSLFRANKLTDIQRLYTLLTKSQNQIDISTYTTLLKGYIDKRKYDQVSSIYGDICKSGLRLNTYVASLMLETYAMQRDKGQLATIVQRIQAEKVALDIALYNQLIKSFLATRQVPHALAVFQQLQKDPNVQVNDVVLNTLINGLLNNRETDAAKKLYAQMLQSKIQPDMITYNTLLKGLTKARDFSGAFTILSNLYERSLEPDIVTYTTLIDAIFENLNPTSTEQILGLFNHSGSMKPNIFTYNVLINGWIRHNNMAEAERTFKDLLASGEMHPTVHTYTNIIQGYVQHGNLPKAMNTFRMMLQSGIQPGRATYHFIISGLIDDDRLPDAVECLKKMRENGTMPTKDTWFMLLNACAEAKQWQLGGQILKHLDDSHHLSAQRHSLSTLTNLPDDILLYILNNFIPLIDLWQLLQISQRIRSLAKDVIRRVWKIDLRSNTESLFRIQFRGALITLDAISTKLPPLEPHPLAQFKAMAGSLIEEECLHQRIIRGIVSHTHRYVLIEDIDTRNRLRAAVDTIFHHVVFVSSGTHREDRWSKASAAAFVRLLKRLDTAFPNHGNEMTYTLSDNLKAFLEYSTYRLMAAKRCGHRLWAIRTVDTLSSCANLIGAALLVKILTEPQVEGAIRKMCELLKDNQIETHVRQRILTTLLNGWLIDREPIYTDICILLHHEIDNCKALQLTT